MAESKIAKTAGARTSAKGLPATSPMTSVLIADLAMRGGERLLRIAVDRAMLGMKQTEGPARKAAKGRSLVPKLIGAAAMRIATTSVPGALIVGGGLLAKTLYDRRKGAAAAKAEGEAQIDAQAPRAEPLSLWTDNGA